MCQGIESVRTNTGIKPTLRAIKKTLPQGESLYYVSFVQQPSLFSRVGLTLANTEHGGTSRRPRRKTERPVSTRRPMHVVLFSRQARGPWSLRKHECAVRDTLRASATRHGVRVYDFANVGTHLHLVVRARRREAFQAFLRSFAGIVARVVTGARRGRPMAGGPFWSALAWSRVVTWGRDYMSVRHYIFRNRIEATDGIVIRRALEQGPDYGSFPPLSRSLPRAPP